LYCSPLNGRAVLAAGKYGNATEGFWLTRVQCTGSEDHIAECARSDWGDVQECDATEPAGVSCMPDSPTAPPCKASVDRAV